MRIGYGELQSPIGKVEIGVVDGALCVLKFEGGRRSLQEIVARQFGEVELCHVPAVDELLARLDAYFHGRLEVLSAIDVNAAGTAFQRLVWSELRRIPAAMTASYADIACSIGNPKAVRAVGAANGSNPVGIVIPCHRVIASNGSLCGYGGGLERKKWLLEHERANSVKNGLGTPAGFSASERAQIL